MFSKEDLLFTLELCKKIFPSNVHPVHFERIREIEKIINIYFIMKERSAKEK